jgi:hypothetical protein
VSRTRTPKPPPEPVPEPEKRASADLLTDWLAQRDKPNEPLRAKQERLLRILAKKRLH